MGLHRDWDLYTRIDSFLFNFNYIDRHYDRGTEAACWPWRSGGTHKQGYGMCGGIQDQGNDTYRRFMTVVHRPLMMRHLGRALTGSEFVIKTCGNPACCNTAHYTLGDHKQKVAVMMNLGRGENNGRHKRAGVDYKQNRDYKYSEEEIAWLRDADTRDIAERYGITRQLAGYRRWEVRSRYKWLPWPNRPQLKGTDDE